MDFQEIDSIIGMLDAKHLGDGVYEKRKSKRTRTDIKIKFLKTNSKGDYVEDIVRNIHPARIVDISTSGSGLITPAVFYVGDTFQCETVDSRFHFRAEFKVIYIIKAQNGFRYGCQFMKIDKTVAPSGGKGKTHKP